MKHNQPTLGVLYINPAGGCNLSCKHCWVNEGKYLGELLTLDQWQELLKQAKDEGATYLKFTGGEPILSENFVPLYEYSTKLFQTIAIETNGTLEPDGIWEAFKKNKPFHVSVSIDNANPELHDEFRGQKGAWKKTINFAKKLVKHKIDNQIIMSVSNTEKEPIEKMIKLVQEIGVYSLKINFIAPSGRGKADSFYNNSSIQNILDFFSWIETETPLGVQYSAPVAFVPIERLKDHGYCPVRNLMGVLPDGTFSLCGVAFSRPEMAWGKFPATSVKEAWNNSPIYRTIRDSVPANLEGVCRICMHRDSCIGNCIVNNMESGGQITSPDILCQMAYEAGLFPKSRIINR